MIPKKIHYCWFGRGQLPELAVSCIKSWETHLPDYEIVMWNEDNFDINSNRYTKEAYEAKKYAFVTDYVRLYVLYHHGGIYMDTDVEVIKPLDQFLKHRAFTGCEDDMMCVTGTMASEKGHKWIEELLLDYNDRAFILPGGNFDNTPNTKVITNTTMRNYNWRPRNEHQILREDLNIYPFDVFCAKEWRTRKITVTENTHTIHHFSASWHTRTQRIKSKARSILGPKIINFLTLFYKK
ncbi:glycosyltransferase family 32 protein [Aeromonas sp. sif2433]|uniref:glycosyltransferase family 32 protein n=1 Tax=Aeromonas sp. sif2433 TaxID=2854794 RepID=UPI001C4822F8|nr:glycosyltransferase [Aeromonas sp. sif2433]MBV7413740.1 glycosyl transferase [Aeromonas sp. sif2433]